MRRRSHINLHALSIISLAIRSAHKRSSCAIRRVAAYNLSIVSRETRYRFPPSLSLSFFSSRTIMCGLFHRRCRVTTLQLDTIFFVYALYVDRAKIVTQSERRETPARALSINWRAAIKITLGSIETNLRPSSYSPFDPIEICNYNVIAAILSGERDERMRTVGFAIINELSVVHDF